MKYMRPCFINASTIPEACNSVLTELNAFGQHIDNGTTEISAIIYINSPTAEPRISKLFPGGPHELEQYRQEICYGILDFEAGHNWHYTYHQRMSRNGQISRVIKELKNSPETRQAIIAVRTDDDIGAESPACLQSVQFLIRDGKLNMSVTFRSEDAYKALFMNIFGLTCLQEEVAAFMEIPVGSYTHYASSLHVYDRDKEAFISAALRIEDKGVCNKELTYNYAQDWKELMEEEQPSIKAMVENQRKKLNKEG